MIGQGPHLIAALAPTLVDCLRVTAMTMMNVPITSFVELITVLVPSHLLLTVVLNQVKINTASIIGMTISFEVIYFPTGTMSEYKILRTHHFLCLRSIGKWRHGLLGWMQCSTRKV